MKLETLLRGKNEEIEEFLKEKTNTRQSFNNEANKLKEEVEMIFSS